MCCEHRTQVILILNLYLFGTAVGSLHLITTVSEYTSSYVSDEANLIYGGNMGLALVVKVLVYFTWLVSEILCLIGALKNNKFLLIPFIIVQGLQIFAFIGLIIAYVMRGNRSDMEVLYYLVIIPLLIGAIGLSICFLVPTIQFYRELSTGVVGGQAEGVVLQLYTSPMLHQETGELSTLYSPPVTENVTCAYQQQPPSYAYSQQEYGYPANNP